MKFRITSFDMVESSPWVLFFLIYFLISTQETEANFPILQCNPYFDYQRRKDTIKFPAMKKFKIG